MLSLQMVEEDALSRRAECFRGRQYARLPLPQIDNGGGQEGLTAGNDERTSQADEALAYVLCEAR